MRTATTSSSAAKSTFELGTGWEATKGECQPTYAVRIDGDRVQVDLASRALRGPSPT